MFAVYDGGKPAKFPEFQVHESWKNNKFNTVNEAVDYANNWLGSWACIPKNPPLKDGIWTVDYGCGNTLTIKEEPGILWQFKAGETCKSNRDFSYVDRLDLDKNGFMMASGETLDVLIVPTDKAKEVADALNSVLGGMIYSKG